jgi:UPF0755 protein
MNKKIYSILFSLFVFALVFLLYVTGRPANYVGFFEVKQGQSLGEISKSLVGQKVLNNRYPFYLYVLISGKANDLKTGEYSFSPKDNFIDIADKIIKGDTYKIKITFPEGFNLKEMENRLENSGLPLELGDFFVKDFKNDFDFLKNIPESASLEGYLFPDTYFFAPNVKEKEIVETFLQNFDKKFSQDLRDEVVKQKKEISDIVAMASLIEKEVKTEEDKRLVSGIFWKRIEIGQPLQSCATIAYILNIDKWIYSYEDTRIVSPYNTYLNRGLPAGPICNPGLESILAALYPQKSDYLYYLSTPEGRTIFSKMLEEHNMNKAKYLK